MISFNICRFCRFLSKHATLVDLRLWHHQIVECEHNLLMSNVVQNAIFSQKCENMTYADKLKPTHCTFNIKTGTWHWPLIKKDKILLNSHQSSYIYRINHDITLYQQLTSNCLVFPLLKRVCFEAGVSRASQKNSFISFSFRPSAHLCVSTAFGSSFRWGQPQKAEVFVRF